MIIIFVLIFAVIWSITFCRLFSPWGKRCHIIVIIVSFLNWCPRGFACKQWSVSLPGFLCFNFENIWRIAVFKGRCISDKDYEHYSVIVHDEAWCRGPRDLVQVHTLLWRFPAWLDQNKYSFLFLWSILFYIILKNLKRFYIHLILQDVLRIQNWYLLIRGNYLQRGLFTQASKYLTVSFCTTSRQRDVHGECVAVRVVGVVCLSNSRGAGPTIAGPRHGHSSLLTSVRVL